MVEPTGNLWAHGFKSVTKHHPLVNTRFVTRKVFSPLLVGAQTSEIRNAKIGIILRLLEMSRKYYMLKSET